MVDRAYLIPQKWEYKVVQIRLTRAISHEELARFGDEGWEMTGCFQNITNGHCCVYYYFKRPL